MNIPRIHSISLWLLAANSLLAQSSAFIYQGQLMSGATPANGTYDLRFRLASDPAGNTYVGSAFLTNGVQVANGLFATRVDFGTGPFNGNSYWLQIDVRTNGALSYTTLTPLQPLAPAPYALYSLSASNLLGTLSASQLSGTVSSINLGGTYSGAVNFNNIGNTFSGSGANLSGVNAASVGGVTANNLWRLNGNSVSPGQFVGSTNNQPLELWAGGQRALRLEPNVGSNAPNVLAGSPWNAISNGVMGSTIGGGGGFGNFESPYWGTLYTNSTTNIIGGNFATIGGGGENTASGLGSTIAGGFYNTASGIYSTVGGGYYNFARGNHSTIGGGSAFYSGNYANGDWSTIAGGSDNTANGQTSFIGGGWFNSIGSNAYSAVIGGGYNNVATNTYAVVPGGNSCIAGGNASFAAGTTAEALHDGSFVWADESSTTGFGSTGSNQFLVRATGGVGIGVSNPSYTMDIGGRTRLRGSSTSGTAGTWFYDSTLGNDRAFLGMAGTGLIGFWGNTGAGWSLLINTTNGYVGIGIGQNAATHLLQVGNAYCDGNTWAPSSDRNLKAGFEPLDTEGVLEKVTALPLSRWHYTNDVSVAHMGPMAQDFYAAFGIGADDKHISDIDEGGVALAAIQGLNQKLETALKAREAENQELKHRLQTLESRLAKLERR